MWARAWRRGRTGWLGFVRIRDESVRFIARIGRGMRERDMRFCSARASPIGRASSKLQSPWAGSNITSSSRRGAGIQNSIPFENAWKRFVRSIRDSLLKYPGLNREELRDDAGWLFFPCESQVIGALNFPDAIKLHKIGLDRNIGKVGGEQLSGAEQF